MLMFKLKDIFPTYILYVEKRELIAICCGGSGTEISGAHGYKLKDLFNEGFASVPALNNTFVIIFIQVRLLVTKTCKNPKWEGGTVGHHIEPISSRVLPALCIGFFAGVIH